MSLFKNRFTAAKEILPNLEKQDDIDLILAPYEEAEKVAESLSEPLEAQKMAWRSDFISSPGSKRINIGAVAEDGTIWIQDSLRNELEVTNNYIEKKAAAKAKDIQSGRNKSASMRSKINGKNVLVVSDGISEGFRETAIAGSLKKKGANQIYVAAPVVSRTMMSDLRNVVDQVFYAREVPFLHSPETCYAERKRKVKST